MRERAELNDCRPSARSRRKACCGCSSSPSKYSRSEREISVTKYQHLRLCKLQRSAYSDLSVLCRGYRTMRTEAGRCARPWKRTSTSCKRSGTDISWLKSPRFVSLTSSIFLVASSFSSCASLASSKIDDTFKVRYLPQRLTSLTSGCLMVRTWARARFDFGPSTLPADDLSGRLQLWAYLRMRG